ncbi:MAG TPA: hypothetical protein VKG26_10430 [Bacteroidia bacterium]|nr:hypothetical protein [Bacteroidia bacterium]
MNSELQFYERLIMAEYITPLSNYKNFLSVRKISTIGNVEKIDSYYEKYISIYKQLYPQKAQRLINIIYKTDNHNDKEKKSFHEEFGNTYLILTNYHCLATYVDDDIVEKLDKLYTDFKTAFEADDKEKMRYVLKIQTTDEDYINGGYRHLEVFNRQEKIKNMLEM